MVKPSKKDLLNAPVRDVSINAKTSIRELVAQFGSAGGFVAKDVSIASSVLAKMFSRKECLTFLSHPADIVATGTRGVIRDLVKNKLVDCVITTCGTLDHDLARLWQDYYNGSFFLDDAMLYHEGVNRLGNVLVPNESYGIVLEEKLQPLLAKIHAEGRKDLSTADLVREIGRHLEGEKRKEESIIYWAYKNGIPVFIPGPTDGAVGFQLYMFMKKHSDFKVDVFKDERQLSNLVLGSREAGALMIGGGISKHHTIWWNQFRDGLDYAVYITTAVEYDGSLSGAPLREAVSWGKVKEDAKQVTVYGDATVLLPLIVAGALGE